MNKAEFTQGIQDGVPFPMLMEMKYDIQVHKTYFRFTLQIDKKNQFACNTWMHGNIRYSKKIINDLIVEINHSLKQSGVQHDKIN